MTTFAEVLGGSRTVGIDEPQWFGPASSELVQGGNTTVLIDAYSTTSSNLAPWPLTLNYTLFDGAGNFVKNQDIASYSSGLDDNFGFDFREVATNRQLVVWGAAVGNDPNATAGNVYASFYDDNGNLLSGPQTIFSNIANLQDVRAGARASFGSSFNVTYTTFDPNTHREVIAYQDFNIDGTPIAGSSGTLLSETNADGLYHNYKVETLSPSGTPNPTYLLETTVSTPGVTYGEEQLQVLNTDLTPQGPVLLVAPAVPVGATSVVVGGSASGRLNPVGNDTNNFKVAYAISYNDASGNPHDAIDVHVMNTSNQIGSDALIPLTQAASSRIELLNDVNDGGFVVGYRVAGTTYLQQFDNSGAMQSAAYALPTDISRYSLNRLSDGNIQILYKTTDGADQQIRYDIYSQVGVSGAGGSPGTTGAAGATGPTGSTGPTTTTTDSGGRFLGKPYSSYTETVAADGTLLDQIKNFDDGSHRVELFQHTQTLHANHDDNFVVDLPAAQGANTFVFSPGFGVDTIHGFNLTGAGHDTLDLPASDFTSIADVLHHTYARGFGSVIVDPVSHDAIRLIGISKSALAHHQNDLKLT